MADFDRIATHLPRTLVAPQGNALFVWKASVNPNNFPVQFALIAYSRADLNYTTISERNYFAKWLAEPSSGIHSGTFADLQADAKAPSAGDIVQTFDGRVRLPPITGARYLAAWRINNFSVREIALVQGTPRYAVGLDGTPNTVRAGDTLVIYRPGTSKRFWYFLDDLSQADSLVTFGGVASQVQGVEIEVRIRARYQPSIGVLDQVTLDDGETYDVREVIPATDARLRFTQLRLSRVAFS